MEQVTVTRIEGIAAYAGEHEIPGIRFKPARQALGVSSWGMNVLELDAHCEGYPEHDHASDGHEEVYAVLRGEAVLRVGEVEHALTVGSMVRVPGALRRKIVTRAQGVTILALGGTPGKAYAASMGG
jgi:mannose-6-phosphate isomerase-like protein (cupin superfamily)